MTPWWLSTTVRLRSEYLGTGGLAVFFKIGTIILFVNEARLIRFRTFAVSWMFPSGWALSVMLPVFMPLMDPSDGPAPRGSMIVMPA